MSRFFADFMPNKIEFKPPENLKRYLGEGLAPGQKVELLTSYRVKEDGNMCITMWDDEVPAPGYNEEGEPEKESGFKERAMGMMNGEMMSDGGGTGY